MKETTHNKNASDMIREVCPGAKIYKHSDRCTIAMPDTSVTWRGATTWIEFKFLKWDESVHDQLDPLQLIELRQLQQQCRRAWVVAYRQGRHARPPLLPSTEIYSPHALMYQRVPTLERFSTLDSMKGDLEMCGLARFNGVNHRVVASLIVDTHG